jgi:hypothetical protein
MSQLDSTHTQGLDDLHFGDGDSYGYAKAQEEKAEEVLTEVAAPKDKEKLKSKRSANYSEEEDVALCHAWMNVSLDASVGTDQCKDKFWQKKIEENYLKLVKIPSYRTQVVIVGAQFLSVATDGPTTLSR